MSRRGSLVLSIALWFLALPLSAALDGQWVLATSTLRYGISRPLQSEGVSHAAKGTGTCQSGRCNFVIEVPIKSFESGDANRDHDMLQMVRGALFQVVTVRMSLPDPAIGAANFPCNVELDLAGRKARYPDVAFQAADTGVGTRIIGTIPATLSDFKIEPTSSHSAGRNEMPIRVDMTWRQVP